MKSSSRLFWSKLFLIVGLCSCFLLPNWVHAELKGGAAAVDITPKQWPIYLRGSFSKKAATSAHDPLHARAVVLKEGDTRLAIVIVDSCMVSRANLDQAKSKASRVTGIPTSHMLVAATHTHSAPYDFARYGTEPEHAYVKQLIDGIAQSIVEANESLVPVEVGYGSYQEPTEVFNRRWFLEPDAMPAKPFGETTDLVKMNPGVTNPA